MPTNSGALIEAVRHAYVKAMQDGWEASKYLQAPRVNPGTQTEANCLKLIELCDEHDLPLYSYMMLAGQYWSVDWLQRCFGRPYPLLPLIVSEKARGRIRKATQKVEKASDVAGRAKHYLNLLSQFTKPEALVLLDAGFCQEQDVVKYIKSQFLEAPCA